MSSFISRNRWLLIGLAATVSSSALVCCGVGGFIWVTHRNGTNGEQVRGSYPSQGQTYQGFNAKHYYAMMLDADTATYAEGIDGLRRLGSEGIPYLLNGILRFRQTGQKDQLIRCLGFCDPRLVDADDLPIFVRLLPTEFSQEAFKFFIRRDGAGRAYLNEIRALMDNPPAPFADPEKRGWGRRLGLPPRPSSIGNKPPPLAPPHLRDQYVWEVRAILHDIDPEHEPPPGESPHERVIREYDEHQRDQREAQRKAALENSLRVEKERQEWLKQLKENSPGARRGGTRGTGRPIKPPQRR